VTYPTPARQPDSTVIAVQVRKVDPPQHLADDMEEFKDLYVPLSQALISHIDQGGNFVPGEWGGEQCDNCGCSGYRIERNSHFSPDDIRGWVIVCDGAFYGTEDEVKGCGTRYMLHYLPEDNVQF
jgi:hypothetical protein